MKKVIIAAGGTGGHLFPGISIGEKLNSLGYDVHLITDLRGKKYLDSDVKLKTHIVNIHISKANLFAVVKSLILLVVAIFKSVFLLYKIKPSIVIGFGGYPTFPPLFASLLLGIPIVIHEQNSFIGKSNRFFAKFAEKIALSYKDTVNVNDKLERGTIFTGDIVRENIKNSPPKSNFHSDVFHILIFGGSQGAKIFSTLIPESIRLLMTNHPNVNVHIIQQVAEVDQKKISQLYDALGVGYKLSEFFSDMDKRYQEAQLVISRSGASTIAELTCMGLPAIFIPLPHSSEDHQLHNAQNLTKIGASWYFNQDKIDAMQLSEKIFELIDNRKILESASLNLLQRRSDGVEILTDTIKKIID